MTTKLTPQTLTLQTLTLQTLLREPLLHFLLIGAIIFFVFAQTNDTNANTDRDIIISQTDLDKLANTWVKGLGRPPTEQEIAKQLKRYIRDQVLYREAMTMGLDKNDIIVRQRLKKKMEYLFNDLSFIPEPTEAELVSFMNEHAKEFTRPASISFRHIFFNPAQRDKSINNDAETLLAQLKSSKKEIDTIQLGDRSLLPLTFSHERKQQLAGIFGKAFADQVFTLPIEGWQGPVTSSFGLHLVYINARTDAQLPPLEKIRGRVAEQWHDAKQKAANEIFYQSLRQRYNIIIDSDVTTKAMTNAAQ